MPSFRRKGKSTGATKVFLLSASILLVAAAAQAATYQYDNSPGVVGFGAGGAWTDNIAVWDLVGSGADNGTDPLSAKVFTSADTVIFRSGLGLASLETQARAGTIIMNDGELFIGNGGFLGATNVVMNGTSRFQFGGSATDQTISGAISGTGGLNTSSFADANFTFTGNNTYTGATLVRGGRFIINGALAGTSGVTVNSGGTIGGTGSITNGVTLNSGATLESAASDPLSIGSLNLASGATLALDTGASPSGASLTVTGNVTLSGNLSLTNSGMTAGKYVLINYGGTLTDTGFALNSVAQGVLSDYYLDTATTGVVRLVSLAGMDMTTVNYWDGTGTPNDDVVTGGNGTWNNVATNHIWTTSNGSLSAWYTPDNSVIFGGTAGTVTVGETVSTSGMTFNTAGYLLSGSTIVLTGTTPTINTANAGTTTITSVLEGTAGLRKTGAGTLTLTGVSTFTGNMAITAGTLIIGGTGQFLNYPGNIANAGAFVYSSSVDQALTGVISGTGTLRMAGSGYLVLSGANTYTGSTTIAAGVISISNSGTLGSGANYAGNIIDNGSFEYSSDANQTLSGIISGTGTLKHLSSATLTLTNAGNTYSGATTVFGGTLVVGGAGALGYTVGGNNYGGNIAVAGLGSLVYGSSANQTLSGIISGNGSLTKNTSSTSTLSLSGVNTYTGNTTISAGTLAITGAGRLGNGAYAGNIVNAGAFTYASSANQTLSGVISGAGTVTKNTSGTSTLTLTGVNTYTGNTTIGAGTLAVTGAGQLGSGTYAGNIANAGAFIHSSSANQTLSGIISGTGTVTKNTSATSVLTLSGANTYSGGTTVSAGTLTADLGTTAGARTVFGSGAITANSGTTLRFFAGSTTNAMSHANALNLNAATLISEDAVQTYSGSVTLTGANTVNVVYSGKDAVLSGIVGGAGSLTKSGAGSLSLSGVNTYTGNTTISAGTLAITGAGQLGSGTYAGTIDNSGAFVYSSSANQTLSGFIASAGSITKNTSTTSILTLSGANSYSGGTTVSAGTLTADLGTTAGARTVFGSGAITANSGTTLRFFAGSTTNAMSHVNALNLNDATLISEDAVQTFGGAVALTGANTVNVVWNGKNAVFSGVVSGAGSLTKSGDGSLSVSATNTYTGNTAISAGTLAVTGSGSLGSGTYAGNIANAGAFLYSSSTNQTLSGIISGAGTLTKDTSATSTLTLTGVNTYTGNTTIGAGTLAVTGTGQLGSGTYAGNIANAGAFVYGSSATSQTLSGIISGTGTLTKTTAATGTLTLTGVNTYTGNTTIGAGTLTLGGAGQLGSGTYAGNIANAGVLNVATSANQTLSGIISGAGSVVKNGAGTLTLTSGATTLTTPYNTYTGGTTVNAGTLNLATPGGTNNSAGGTIITGKITINSGATVNTVSSKVFGWDSAFTGLDIVGGTFNTGVNDINFYNSNPGIIALNMTGGTMTIGGAGSQIKNAPITVVASPNQAVINGAGVLLIRDGSTQSFTVGDGALDTDLLVSLQLGESGGRGAINKSGAGKMALSAVNTFTGSTTITAGTLAITGAGQLEAGNYSGNIANAGAFLYDSSANQTIAGIVSGTGTLTKATSATSTLTLSGVNTYTGNTTISAGTFAVGGTGQLGSGTYAGNIANAGAFVYGSSANQTLSGIISGTGTLTKTTAATGTLTLTGVNTYTGNTTIGAGTFTLGGAGQLGSGTYAGNIANAGVLNVATSANQTISGLISGAGSLVKNGAGTLTLNTSYNTFTGGTTVNAGTLNLATPNGSSGNSILTGRITINTGGTVNATSANVFGWTNGFTGLDIVGGTFNAGANDIHFFNDNAGVISLNMTGGTLTVESANGMIKNAPITVVASANQAVISGSGALNIREGSTQNFVVGDGAQDADLLVSLKLGESIGTGAISKSGAGKMALSGVNTFTGGTTISAGTLAITGAGQLGSGTYAGNIANAAAFDYASSANQTLSGIISGTGTLAKTTSATGTLTLTGVNTYTGNTTIGAGTLTLGGAGQLGTGTYAGNIANAGVLNVATSANQTISGLISGTGSLVKNGAGTLTLNTSYNTFIGGTTVNAGVLNLATPDGNSGNSILTGKITINTGGTVNATSNNVFGWTNGFTGLDIVGGTFNAGSNDIHFYNDNAGVISLNMTGGTLTVDSANGMIRNAPITVVASANQAVINGSGVLNIRDNSTQSFVVGDGTQDADLLVSLKLGERFGTGAISKSGTGKLALSGVNTFTGDTTITAGTLAITGAGQLASGTYAGNIANTGAFDYASSANQTLSGIISGSGTLAKTTSATGTLTLTGVNTYTGNTTIGAGTLTLGGAGQLGSGTYAGNIANAGILNVATSANQTLSGMISGTGSLVKNGAGTLTLTSGASVLNSAYNTYTGGTTVNAGVLNLATPGGLVMGGSILTGKITINSGATVNATSANVLGWNSSFTGLDIVGGTFNTGTNDIHFYNATAGVIALNMTGGTMTIGGAGSMIRNAPITVIASANQAVIDGAGTLSIRDNSTQSFVVGDGAQDTDLLVSLKLGQSAGTGAISKSGTGKMALSAVNTFAGDTTITAGTLAITGAGQLASGAYAGNIANTGAFDYASSANQTLSGIISGTGTLAKTTSAAGTLTLTGVNTYTGNTTIGAGTLTLGGAGQLGSGTYAGNIANAGALLYSSSANQTLSGIISGTGTLTKATSATSTLTLSGANTFTGATTVTAGTLALAGAGQVTIAGDASNATTDLYVNGGTLTWGASEQIGNGATLDLTSGTVSLSGRTETLGRFTNSGGTFTTGLNGKLIGTGTSVVWSGGTNTINDGGLVQDAHIVISGGTNTVQGGTTGGVLELSNGGIGLEFSNGATLTLNSDAAVAGKLSILGNVYLTDATTARIAVGGSAANAGTVDFNTQNRTISTVTGGVLAIDATVMNGALTKTGAGTLTLGGTSTYAGSTTISAGTLAITGTGRLGSGAYAGNIANAGALLVSSSSNQTLSGIISGTGTLTKNSADSSTLTLSGANTYTGATTVDAGTLAVTGTLATSGVTVNTATLTGTGTITNGVTVSNTGTLAAAASNDLTVGSLSLAANSTLALNTGAAPAAASVGVTGNLTLDGGLRLTNTGMVAGTYNLVNYGGTLTDNTLTLTSVTQGVVGDYYVDTSLAGKVRLVSLFNQDMTAVNYWDGAGDTGDGIVSGGDGTWNTTATNRKWTTSTGNLNAGHTAGNSVIFGATAGTATVAGTVSTSGMKFDTAGYTLTGGTVTLTGTTVAINAANAGTTTIASELAGTSVVNKSGAGTLALSGVNTYTGNTTITGGALAVTGTGRLSSGTYAGTIANAGSFTYSSSANQTLSGVISGTGTLTKAGSATSTLTLSGANTYTGVTTISAGTLRLGGMNSVPVIVGDADMDSVDLVINGGTLSWGDTYLLNQNLSIAMSSGEMRMNGNLENIRHFTNSGGTFVLGNIDRLGVSHTATLSGGTTTIGNGGELYANHLIISGNGTTVQAGGVLLVANPGGSLDFLNASTLTLDSSATAGTSGILVARNGIRVTDATTNIIASGGTATHVGRLTFAGDPTAGIDVITDGVLSISASVQDGGLVKTGSGLLALSGVNTYIGDTTISAGTVSVTGSGQLASGSYAGAIANTGAFVYSSSANQTLSGIISGTGTLTKDTSATSTLTLTGVNTYTGNTTISAGTLAVTGAGQLASGAYAGNITNDGAFLYSSSASQTLSGIVSGTGTLTKATSATNTLTLTGVNTYTGNTTISAGTLAITGAGQLGSGTYTGNIANAGALRYSSSANQTLSGILSGTGTLTKATSSTSTLTLSGANTFTGLTTVTAGTLNLAGTGITLAGDGVAATTDILVNGGTLALGAAEQIGNNATLDMTSGTVSLNGHTETLGRFTNSGGTFTTGENGRLIGTGASVVWSGGTNTINSGGIVQDAHIVISGGTNTVEALGVLRSVGGFSLIEFSNGATVTLTSAATNPGAITGEGTIRLTDATTASILTAGSAATTGRVNLAGGARTFDIVEAGGTLLITAYVSNGGVTKTGAGTLSLNGLNTYAGSTTISAGTLTVGGSGVLGATVSGSDYVGNYNAAISIANGANFRYASSRNQSISGVISGDGALVKEISGTGTLTLSAANSYTGATTVDAGTLAVTGSLASSGVTVNNGGTLTGTGTITNGVTVNNGGTLAAVATNDLTVGSLTLSASSALALNTGAAPSAASVGVTGALTLDGNLALTNTGMVAGVYDLINYGGTLTDNTLALTSVTEGVVGDYYVDTSLAGKVRLVSLFNQDMTAVNYWDGSGTTNDGTVSGGDGTWNTTATNRNWTTSTGNLNAGYTADNAVVFGATAGTVTVDGTVATSGMTFDTAGYTLTGGTVTLTGTTAAINTANTGTTTVASVLNGTAALDKTGAGTLTLSGTNGYTGATTVSTGTLAVTGSLATSGVTVSNGATLTGTGTITNGVTVNNGGTLAAAATNDLTVGALTLSASSALALNTGAAPAAASVGVTGNLTLDGDLALTNTGMTAGVYSLLTYGGALTDNTLALTSVTEGVVGDYYIDTATTGTVKLVSLFNQDMTAVNYWDGSGITNDGTVSGGTGTWNTTTTNRNWTTSTGNLNAGYTADNAVVFGATAGTVTVDGTVATSGMTFDTAGYTLTGGTVTLTGTTAAINTANTGTTTVASVLNGTAALDKTGAGTLTLSGTNGYTGATTVSTGTLAVTGSLATSGVTVSNGATLTGTGTITNGVTVNNGGTLAAVATNDLTVGALTLSASSILALDTGASPSAASVNITGAFTLDGNLALTNTGMTAGTYDLINYGGTLTDNGITLTSVTQGVLSDYYIDTSSAGKVKLVMLVGADMTGFNNWDGSGSTNDGTVSGGDGTWNTTATNRKWTTSDGTLNAGHTAGNAVIFGATAGTVTVENTVVASGMKFDTAGYTLTGGTVTLTGTTAAINTANTGTTTIASVLDGTSALDKTGAGTLTLSGTNGYTGATTVSTGTLAVTGSLATSGVTVSNGATLTGTGTITNGVTVNNGGTLAAAATNDLTVGALTLSASSALALNTGAAPAAASVGITGNLTLDGNLTLTNTGMTAGVYSLLTYGGALTDNTLALTSVTEGAVGDYYIDTATTGKVKLVSLFNQDMTAVNYWDGSGATNDGTVSGGNGTWNTTATNRNWTTSTGNLNAGYTANNAVVFGATAGTVTVDGTVSTSGMTFDTAGYSISNGIVRLTGTTATINTANVGNTTIASVLSGTAALDKTGAGTLTLTGDNGYTGATTVSAGTLAVTDSLATSGVTVSNGATLTGTGTITNGVTVNNGGTLAAAATNDLTVGSLTLSASSALALNTGAAPAAASVGVTGNLTLDGNLALSNTGMTAGVYSLLTYGGALTDNTLALTSVTEGAIGDYYIDTATTGTVKLVSLFNQDMTAVNYWDGSGTTNDGTVSGGTGTWNTTATNRNWTTSTGNLNAGYTADNAVVFGATAGTVTVDGTVATSGMTFDTAGYTLTGGTVTLTGTTAAINTANTGTTTVASVLNGTAALDKTGAGTLTLSGTNGYTGATTVSTGTLAVTGSLATSGVTVSNGSTLTGTGSITNGVTVNNGGTLAAAATNDITVGSLTLSASSALALNTGAAPAAASVGVTGNLTLDGNLALTNTGMTAGVYSLLTYGGALTDNTLALTSVTEGAVGDYYIDTATTGTVKLVSLFNQDMTAVNYWDGSGTTNDGTVSGGNGTWNTTATNRNWTTSTGNLNAGYTADNAVVFGATAGTVTVDGTVATSGMTFDTAGYTLTGGTVTLTGTTAAINTANTGTTTIASVLNGTAALDKTGAGTLTLSGTNGYTGATTVSTGTLAVTGSLATSGVTVSNGATLTGTGTITNGVTVNNGGTLASAVSAPLSVGSLTLTSASTLALNTGASPATASLQVNGNLALDGNLALTNAGMLGGTYDLINYTGALTDNGLVIDSVTQGVPSQYYLDTATIGKVKLISLFNQDMTVVNYWDGGGVTNDGIVSGGDGVWGLSATKPSWTNSTGTLNGGYNQGNAVIFGATAGTVTVDGTVATSGMTFDTAGYTLTGGTVTLTGTTAAINTANTGTTTVASVLNGTAALDKTGAGTLTLSGTNGYTGATTVSTGTLAVTGSLATSGVTVSNGATLTGTGTITNGVTVNNGGTLAAAATNDLTVGSLTLSASSALALNTGAAPAAASVGVTGNLTLDGNLALTNTGMTAGVYSLLTYGGALTDNTLALTSVTEGAIGDYYIDTATTGTVKLVSLFNQDMTAVNYWDGSGTTNDGTVSGGTGTWNTTATNRNWTTSTGNLNAGYTADNAVVFGATAGTVTVDGTVATSGMTFDTAGYTLTGGTVTLTGTTAAINTANTGTTTIASVLNGTAALDKTGAGTLTLSGTNGYTGATTVSTGTLAVTGSLATSGVTVSNGGTLTGTGTITNGVTVNNGGTLAAVATNDLTVGSLTLSASSILALDTGSAPGNTAPVAVTGALTLDGELALTNAGMTAGVYNLLTYGGALTDNGLILTSVATGTTADYYIDTTLANKVRLISLVGQDRNTVNYWDGSGVTNDGTVSGGSGIWTNDQTVRDWTTSTGSLNAGYNPGNSVVFGGTAGTVTVDGTVATSGMTFDTTGYTLTAGTVALTGTTATINTSTAGTTTIASTLGGTAGLDKTGIGTLTLTGNNTYTGATSVTQGRLSVDGTLATSGVTVKTDGILTGTGTITNGVTVNNGGTLAVAATNDLTVGSLALNAGSWLTVDTGAAPAAASLFVNGNLTMGGYISLNNTGMTAGVYDLINYGGTLTNSGASIASVTQGTTADYYLDTATSGKVKLVSLLDLDRRTLGYWDGDGPGNDGTVSGGSGVWTNNPAVRDWTNSDGTINGPYNPGNAVVFGGSPGTVTVDGTVSTSGLTFTTPGYTLTGGTVILTGPVSTINTANPGNTTIATTINGTSGLDKTGTGTLTLSGTNGYTGATTVTEGTLNVTGTVAGTGVTVKTGGTLTGTGTINNDVIVKQGGTLAATSPASTPLDIGGRLIFEHDLSNYAIDLTGSTPSTGAPVSVRGDLILDGTLAVTGKSAGAYELIDYKGTLTDNNMTVGTVTLGTVADYYIDTATAGKVKLISLVGQDMTQVNVWDGARTSNDGIVNGGDGVWNAASANRTWTTATGSINAGHTAGNAVVFSQGSGTVTVDTAAGAVTTSGIRFASTSGAYTITGGELTLTGATPTITVDSQAAQTIASVITGTAGLTKEGAGTLVLSGTNTYTGGTTVAAGTLALDAHNGTLATTVTGAGTLALTGAGTTKLDAPRLKNATVVVKSGHTLDLGTERNLAQLAALTIDSGAFLRGQGSVGSLTNNGDFRPGNSPGVVNIAGDFVNNGTLTLEIAGHGGAGAANGHDQINATGKVTIKGTLAVNFINGYNPDDADAYTLVTGRTVTSSATILVPTVTGGVGIVKNTGTALVYTYAKTSSGVPIDTPKRLIPFKDELFDAGTGTGTGMGAIIKVYNEQGSKAATQALANSSPLLLGSLTTLPIDEARGTVETMRTRLEAMRRLDYSAETAQWVAYAAGAASYSKAFDGWDNATFDRSYMTGKVGLEKVASVNTIVGANLGYDRGRAIAHAGGGSISQDHASASAYVSNKLSEHGYLNVGVFVGRSDYDTRRHTALGADTGETEGWDAGMNATLGTVIPMGESVEFRPYVGGTYTHARVHGFSERGDANALRVFEYADNSFRSKLGGDLDWKLPAGSNDVRLGLAAAWEHEFTDNTVDIPARLKNRSTKFLTESETMARDYLTLGPVLTLNWGAGNSIRVSYQFEYGFEDERGHRGDIAYSKRF